jgi:single-stranded-DNA-specific exonuclease
MKSQAKYLENSKNVYKTIRLRSQNNEEAKKISAQYNLSPVAANALAARGFKADLVLSNYIKPSLREGLPDPKGLKNLDKACELISETLKKKGKIAICCDFDVDGLSGGSQLHAFLNVLGVENKVFVPDRFEDGYGLNEKMIRQIAKDKYALVICIDYGTTNIKELNLARELGLKSIVVDHHHVGDIKPACDVFVNPNQKDCGFSESILCASGLTFYLLLGLKNCLKEASHIDIKDYLDLACLGTICDMVPLRGVNRIIAKRGLELLTKTTRPGLQALKNVSGLNKEIQCSHVSFGIGPRLNAAGRMIHGDVVVELLTTNDSVKAEKLAQQLNRLNLERQEIEQRVKEKAVYLVNGLEKLPYGIVVHDNEFHTGVIGIVAQRLVEAFYRPSIVLGMDDEGTYKGSVRGIKGFSVIEALNSVSKYLIKFGGHEGAGGLAIKSENLEAFALAFADVCEERLLKLEIDPYVEADAGVFLSDLDLDLVKELKSFAPFGVGNPSPVLLIHNLKVKDVRVLKNTHLKVTFSDGKRYLTGFLWKQTEHPELLAGNKVNLAFRPDENTFNGSTEIQANIQAVERA